MARALSGMLDRVEDDLFELAEKAVDRESQNMYLDARAQARDKRTAIESAFGRHFVELFNRKCGDQTPVPVAARVRFRIVPHKTTSANNIRDACRPEHRLNRNDPRNRDIVTESDANNSFYRLV
jgi:hypothetical protein